MQIKSMDPMTLKKRLEEGSVILIDVRAERACTRAYRRRKARAAVALSGRGLRRLARQDRGVSLPQRWAHDRERTAYDLEGLSRRLSWAAAS